VPGTGHMVPRHQPQALARLLIDFLEEGAEPR
jgi:pimeloyl-ACP methyl ester carboxylesterase